MVFVRERFFIHWFFSGHVNDKSVLQVYHTTSTYHITSQAVIFHVNFTPQLQREAAPKRATRPHEQDEHHRCSPYEYIRVKKCSRMTLNGSNAPCFFILHSSIVIHSVTRRAMNVYSDAHNDMYIDTRKTFIGAKIGRGKETEHD